MVKVEDAAGTPVAACGVAQSGRTPAKETRSAEALVESVAGEPVAEAAAAPSVSVPTSADAVAAASSPSFVLRERPGRVP